jgi:DNA-binding SARP family transcriptional activator/TolB-like protein
VIRLRILGPIELIGTDGEELRAVLAQPKRLALLTYLAAAAPRGFQRRDTLLALFWPELDGPHARDALKQAVRFLRQALGRTGSRALVSRNAEDLGIDPEALWCDAAAFGQALDTGLWQEALELYRGDLLEGFFSNTSAAHEEWLEQERARLRAGAARAARAIAEQRERDHDYTMAVSYARRAVELSDWDERMLRQLLNLLDCVGDRAGALHAYDVFVRRLAHAYEAEPAAETRAVIERIRARSDARDPEPEAIPYKATPHAKTSPPVFAPTIAPESLGRPAEAELRDAFRAEETGQPITPPVSRRLRVGLGPGRRRLLIASLLAPLVAAAVLLWRDAPRADVQPDDVTAPYRVAVMPFIVRGDDELAYLGEGMVDLLSVNLDGAGDLRSVNPRTLLSLVARRGGTASVQDLDRARSVARELGARAYVLGTVVALGKHVRIAAWLYPLDPTDGDTVQASVEGDVRDAATLVDGLTTQLLLGRTRGESTNFARLAAGTTLSLPALKAYLDGETRWRARQSDSALAAFRRAVEHDTTFALAYYRLAVAAEWSLAGDPEDAVQRALRYSDRLPVRYRQLLKAFDARRRGSVAKAESLYVSVLRSDPDDGEAWFQLGTLRTPQALPWGRPIDEAREAFEHTLALDPDHPRAPGVLSWLDGHEGHHDQAVSQLERLAKLTQAEGPLFTSTALAFARGDETARREAISLLRRASDPRRIHFAADFVAQRVGDLEGGIRAARVLTDPSRPRGWRAFGHVRVADIEFARGRQHAGWTSLAEAERLTPIYGLHARVHVALSPFFEVPQSELAALRNGIANWVPLSTRDSIHQDYLLARLTARLGDQAGALRHGAKLESRSAMLARLDSAQAQAMARDLALAVRADVAWRSGRRAEALSLLERWRPEKWWMAKPTVTKPDPADLSSVLPGHAYSYERWMHADLLASLGRPHDALNWYNALGFLVGEEMRYLAPSRLRMGELYERLSEREQAIEQYARFVKLWRECDPELRPLVEDVRGRISRLRAGPDARGVR